MHCADTATATATTAARRLALGAAAAAAAIAGALARPLAARVAALDGEQMFGVLLLLASYVLAAFMALLLVRRKRVLDARAKAVADAAAASSSCEKGALWADCALYGPLAGMGVDLGAAAVRRDVDACTQTVSWPASGRASAGKEEEGKEEDEEGTQCVVCLADVEGGEQCRVLRCKHVFHTQCADLWLVVGRKNACPTCAAVVCPGRDHDMRVKGD